LHLMALPAILPLRMETASGSLTSSRHTVLSLLGAAADYLRSRGFDEARLHVELLLSHVLRLTRIDLYLQFDRPLTAAEVLQFKELFRRRLTHEPLQYILGETEFMGLALVVDAGVLVPRPETELLVERAIAFASARNSTPVSVLDACTGSGCIAVSLAHRVPGAVVTGIDISSAALRVAAANAGRHVPGRVELSEADLFSDFLPGRTFDLLVSNPPYISAEEFGRLEPEVREFEPRIATTDNADGFTFHRRLAEVARDRLKPEGAVMVEAGFGQAARVAEFFEAAGITGVCITPDYAGIPRIVEGRRA
jgi:release factor glutamine methyltransferase